MSKKCHFFGLEKFPKFPGFPLPNIREFPFPREWDSSGIWTPYSQPSSTKRKIQILGAREKLLRNLLRRSRSASAARTPPELDLGWGHAIFM